MLLCVLFWQPYSHSLEVIHLALIFKNPFSIWCFGSLLCFMKCSSFNTHLSHTFCSVSLPNRLLLPLFSSPPGPVLLNVGDCYSMYLLWEWHLLGDFIHPHNSKKKSQVSSSTIPLTAIIPIYMPLTAIIHNTCPAVSAPLIYRTLVLFCQGVVIYVGNGYLFLNSKEKPRLS